MRQSRVIAFRVEEGLHLRHLHKIVGNPVEGAGAAVADLRAGRGKKAFGGFLALKRRRV